ncbi:MAG: HPF/RaiA family ribosome-associated protein [Actinomycetota bacterium]
MELTFTGRGLHLTDDIRAVARHKVAPLARIEPRTTRIDLEFIAEHHPKPGTARVEGALATPRKTFRAHGDGRDVASALDAMVGRLERQLRDHHGKRRAMQHKGDGLESAHLSPASAETAE